MRDLPPDENLGRRRRRRRVMDRSMLALVLSAVFLGLVLIVYFVLQPPVAKPPIPTAGRAGSSRDESRSRPAPAARDARRASAGLSAKSDEDVVPQAETTLAEISADGVKAPAPQSRAQRMDGAAPPGVPGAEDVRIDFIVASVISSPHYSLVDGPERRFRPGSWLQVEVDFTTFPASIPDLVLRYSITLRGETFIGTVEHAGLNRGAHRSVAYLVPRRTERYAVNGKLPERVLQSVVVAAYERGGLVARGGIGNTSSVSAEPIEGFVRSLEQTPFSPLFAGSYEPVAPPEPPKVREKEVPEQENRKRAPIPERAPRLTQTSDRKE